MQEQIEQQYLKMQSESLKKEFKLTHFVFRERKGKHFIDFKIRGEKGVFNLNAHPKYLEHNDWEKIRTSFKKITEKLNKEQSGN